MAIIFVYYTYTFDLMTKDTEEILINRTMIAWDFMNKRYLFNFYVYCFSVVIFVPLKYSYPLSLFIYIFSVIFQ
jgi:hypothetical protein